MIFTPKKSVKKFQQGGEMPVDESVAPQDAAAEAPAEGAGQDPIMMLALAAAQALQTQECLIAMQVCQGLVQLVQQMSAPQETQGEPIFKKGGRLVRRIKK